jgi:DNA replication ATP-dependent helicase/nuclease Dna2
VTPQQLEIVEAIEQELDSASRKRHFKVVSAVAQKSTIAIKVRSHLNRGKLDYTLEGGVASWGQSVSTVVAVSVDDSIVYVHRIDAPVPVAGTEMAVQPPRFLESLLQCWKDETIATECFSWAAHALVGRDRCPLVLSSSFSELRERQRSAYSLLSYRAGFLWGPPGTGKTRTAASIVADLVTANSDARVLLFAPTNSAVDQLLTAVDERLSLTSKGQRLRTHCARFGSNFVARYYEKRQHLLPQDSEELVLRKARLEANRPSADEVEARALWEREMDPILASLRSLMQTVLQEKRVVAMTAILGTMHYRLLQERSPFDVIVFDEASQMGRAISFILAPLARCALVAGDPKQLAPIFTSTYPVVRKWFGHTLFDEYMHDGHPSTCFLNEQSRMAVAICGLVSQIFYRGELRVSHDCLRDSRWHAAREPLSLFPGGQKHNIHLVKVDAESEPHSGSHRRPESAKIVAAIVQQLMNRTGPAHILVLTPFVGQKKLIRDTLNARGLRKVRVSTVHAAQGSEMHTIIFDPVKGNSRFLTNPGTGARLFNVAISRAQACFVLLASVGDLEHPLLSAIADYIRFAPDPLTNGF